MDSEKAALFGMIVDLTKIAVRLNAALQRIAVGLDYSTIAEPLAPVQEDLIGFAEKMQKFIDNIELPK